MDGEKLPAVSWKTPLVFQSKLLFLSLLYLLTSLFLSIYVSISQTGCVFRFSPLPLSDHERHLGHPLFSYPTVYGEHKHALPSSSPSPTCDSPVLFPDYLVAFEEIQRLSRNWSYPLPMVDSPVLRYIMGKRQREFLHIFIDPGTDFVWTQRCTDPHHSQTGPIRGNAIEKVEPTPRVGPIKLLDGLVMLVEPIKLQSSPLPREVAMSRRPALPVTQ